MKGDVWCSAKATNSLTITSYKEVMNIHEGRCLVLKGRYLVEGRAMFGALRGGVWCFKGRCSVFPSSDKRAL